MHENRETSLTTESGKSKQRSWWREGRKVAREKKQERFTTMLHHITLDLLRNTYFELSKKAASGVDGVTWAESGEDLESRLADLKERIHRGDYRAKASRRIYIPQAGELDCRR